MSLSFVEECLPVLIQTPKTLDAMLRNLPEVWTEATEGADTWSPYTVIGHLNHCERADWMPRMEIILNHGTAVAFDPFDREAQFRDSVGKSLPALLDEFIALRAGNLAKLQAFQLTEEHLELEGLHPALGHVTLRQLLATWTAHDLAHILQVSRIMAKRMRNEVGPWAEYLSVMK